MSEKYNGWTNQETWLVAVYINNDEGWQGYWRERADDCIDYTASVWGAAAALANELESDFQEAYHDHLRWVIRGRVGEIEDWASQIQEDSDG